MGTECLGIRFLVSLCLPCYVRDTVWSSPKRKWYPQTSHLQPNTVPLLHNSFSGTDMIYENNFNRSFKNLRVYFRLFLYLFYKNDRCSNAKGNYIIFDSIKFVDIFVLFQFNFEWHLCYFYFICNEIRGYYRDFRKRKLFRDQVKKTCFISINNRSMG